MTSTRRAAGRAGYTLPEMVVVLGIMATVLAIGFPEMARMVRKAKLEGGVGTMEAALRVTREKALAHRTHYRVTLNPQQGRFEIDHADTGGTWVSDADSLFQFPAGIGYEGKANATSFSAGGGTAELLFEPRGTVSTSCTPLKVTFYDDRGDTMYLEMVRTGRVRTWH